MGHVWLTGNHGIDSATVEIAKALRKACPVLCGDQYHYEQAAALRDQIMAGTRELDHEAALGSDGSFDYRDARGAVPRAEGVARAEDVIREGR